MIEAALDAFLLYLMQKYPVDNTLNIFFQVDDVEVYFDETTGQAWYGQLQENYPVLFIFIAGRCKFSPLIILAHEYCHILQMYKWNTFPNGLHHPPQDHELEKEACSFAEDEVRSYESRGSQKV